MISEARGKAVGAVHQGILKILGDGSLTIREATIVLAEHLQTLFTERCFRPDALLGGK